MPCVFCGRIPDRLPHMCLLDKRNREEEALLAIAFDEERRQNERREYGRALARVADLERQYSALVEEQQRIVRSLDGPSR